MRRPYSAFVELNLVLQDGTRFSLTHTGPDSVRCKDPQCFKGEIATLMIQVDDQVIGDRVRLGIMERPSHEVPYEAIERGWVRETRRA